MASFIILVVVFAVIAFLGGVKYRELNDKIKQLQENTEDDDETPFVDVSPKAVNQRIHDSNRDQESAVITAKTPQQIKAEKEAKLNAFLDNYSGKK